MSGQSHLEFEIRDIFWINFPYRIHPIQGNITDGSLGATHKTENFQESVSSPNEFCFKKNTKKIWGFSARRNSGSSGYHHLDRLAAGRRAADCRLVRLSDRPFDNLGLIMTGAFHAISIGKLNPHHWKPKSCRYGPANSRSLVSAYFPLIFFSEAPYFPRIFFQREKWRFPNKEKIRGLWK